MHVRGGCFNTFCLYYSVFSAIAHDILPLHQPSKQWFSHRFHRITQMVRVRKILPQIAQNSQKLLLGMTSHRLHRSTQKLLISGGALVSSAPTEQTVILPQISQNYTDGLGAKDSPTDCTEFTEAAAGDNLPQISQICTDAANFRGCTCLKCTNLATLVYFLLGWCT